MSIRLDDADLAALTARAPKLSRIRPAHWRGVFQLGPVADYWFLTALRLHGVAHTRAERFDGGVWRETNRHVSAERCEHLGLMWAANACTWFGDGEVRFLRAEKFEGEGL